MSWRGILALAAFSVLAAAGGAQTGDDHGNSIGSATAIGVNTSVSGSIGAAGDQDYFRITLNTAGTLTVYTTGSTDTFGRLLDGNGVELTNNDDATDLNFRISRSVSAGTYYIAVRHYSSSGTGSYVLRVEGPVVSDDHGNSIGSATAIGTNTTVAGAINGGGDQDYFRITLTAAGTLTVYTTGSTDTFGQLLDGNGVELASNDDATDLNFRISRSVNAGTYYIAVRHFDGAGTGSYSLRADFVPVPPPGDDHGNSAGSATSVTLNSTVAGVLNTANDIDYFRVTLGGTARLVVYTTGGTDTLGSLRNGSDQQIVEDDDGNGDRGFRIERDLSGGTYYVRVTGYGGATGSYSLRVETTAAVTAPSVSTATPAAVTATGATLGGNVTGSGGATVTQRGIVYGTSQNPTTSSGTFVTVGSGTGSFSTTLDGALIPNTTYYVRAFAINSAGTAYGSQLSFTTQSNPLGDDHGNSAGSATSVALNSTVAGVLNTANDIDYFRVTLGGTARLVVYTTGGTDTLGSLRNGSDQQIVEDDDGNGDRGFRIERDLSGGTYYVRVTGYGGATGSYSLRVETTAAVTAPSVSTATPAAVTATGATLGGNVTGSGGATVTQRGIVYGTSQNPTTSSGTFVTVGSGTGSFSTTLDGALIPNTTYYVRAFAINSAGTAYGSQLSFTTQSNPLGDDHGNSAGAATSVALNSTVAGLLSPAGDQDYFRVALTTSGTLTVYTTGSTDTFGRLLDGNGVELANNDDATDLNFRISRSVSAGTYYIAVRHYSGSGTGAYSLRVEFVPNVAPAGDDHGNSASTATAIGTNQSILGTINPAGDLDYFRLTLTSGGPLTIYTTGSTDTFGRLLDSNGVELASNDDATDTNFRISRTVSAGTYYVAVRHYSTTGTGAYSLRADFAPPPTSVSDDHGNSVGAATAIGTNTTVAGAINGGGDQDYFRITLTAAGTLTVYTTGSTDTFGRLLDSNGVELASNDDATDLNFRIGRSVNAGTYYIAVRHFSATDTGAYGLRADFVATPSNPSSDDHGNSVGAATAIGTNTTVAGAINGGGDQDYFRITLTAAGTLTVYTTGSTDTFGRLLDATGAELASNDDATDLNFRIGRSVGAGTYFIAVRHFSATGTGTYGLRADFVATPSSPSSDDHGNGLGSATAIGTNATVTGAIGSPGDQDYFRITLSAAGTLTVYTTGSTDTFGRLLDGNGAELASSDDAADLNFRISRTVGAGTYYIAVRHFSSTGTGAYGLRADHQPTDVPAGGDDHGNSVGSATAIGTNATVTGSIGAPGDQDYFRVTLSAAGTLTVYTTGSTDTFGRLLDGNGVELASNDDATDLNFRINRTVGAGTYYVMVRHYSPTGTGAYSLRADFAASGAGGAAQSSLQVELSPSIPQQVTVGTPVAISGRLLRAGSPAGNQTFYVSDGLQLMSRIVSTDAEGRFSFVSTPSSNRAAVVEFHDQSRVMRALLFHVTNSANLTRSAFVDAVLVRNDSGRRARVTITNPFNESEHIVLQAGQVLKVAESLRTEIVRRSSFSAGSSINAGIIGGSAMVDPSSNEMTMTFTGGTLLARGSVYYTSNDEFGVCWSPGADVGAAIEIEGQLCVGTDGISVGVGGSSAALAPTGVNAAAFSFRVVEW